jgi:hypothetical protein
VCLNIREEFRRFWRGIGNLLLMHVKDLSMRTYKGPLLSETVNCKSQSPRVHILTSLISLHSLQENMMIFLTQKKTWLMTHV